jgi:Ca-activated chloride channel family protein
MMEFLNNIQFEQAQWLAAIPVVAIFLALVMWINPALLTTWQQSSQTGRKNTYYLPVSRLIAKTSQQAKPATMKFTLPSQYLKYLLFFTMMLLALAQPYQQGQKLPEPPVHHDIVFLVDTSVTMSLKDYQYNNQRIERMAMLKNVLKHFIKKLDGSRIGINVYSEQVYTLAPLTTDYALLNTQLQRLESAVLTGRTSNPSQALLYTAKQHQKNPEKPALVLLTDINRPHRKIDPRVAAKYLAQQGFHLHIIGIGAGSQQAQDEDISSLIYQPANFQLLEAMTNAGKGNFFWVKSISSLNSALANIQKAEKRIVDVQPEYIKQPLYMWFVIFALGWVSFWQLLPLMRVTL